MLNTAPHTGLEYVLQGPQSYFTAPFRRRLCLRIRVNSPYLLALSFTSVVVIFTGLPDVAVIKLRWNQNCGNRPRLGTKLTLHQSDKAQRQTYTSKVNKKLFTTAFFSFSLGCKCFYEQSRDGSQFFFLFFFLAAVEQMINLEKRPDRY